jgi:hypothetical protein
MHRSSLRKGILHKAQRLQILYKRMLPGRNSMIS